MPQTAPTWPTLIGTTNSTALRAAAFGVALQTSSSGGTAHSGGTDLDTALKGT